MPLINQFVGEKVNDLELVEEVGRGNIGVVYKAYNKEFNYYRACKLIPKVNLKPNWEVEIKKSVTLVGIVQIAQYISYDEKSFGNTTQFQQSWSRSWPMPSLRSSTSSLCTIS